MKRNKKIMIALSIVQILVGIFTMIMVSLYLLRKTADLSPCMIGMGVCMLMTFINLFFMLNSQNK